MNKTQPAGQTWSVPRRSLFHFLFWFVCLTYLETLLHFVIFKAVTGRFFYILGFSAAIAEKAIPACSLCFVSGSAMSEEVTPYYEALFRADPASIGGSLPDDGFYYVP